MNISNRKRILLVEDRKALRENFAKNIRNEVPEIDIDEAESEEAGLQSIRNRTYHLAILDIMLTDQPTHRGGLVILDTLRTMNEGTLAIMLSGTPDIDCAIRAIRSRIVVDYVHKDELRRSLAPLINPIHVGLKEVHIPVFGKYGRLSAYISAPDDPAIWEYSAMNALSSMGFDPLNSALSDVFRNITPVLPQKATKDKPSLTVDKNHKAIHGIFWSKALGCAIAACLWAPTGQPIAPEGATERHDVLGKNPKHLCGAIWRVPMGRNDFVENIWDI
ncbi:MAG TPA: response regulator [Pyrinomonadaceae bacterium]|nr:response regulator [Pyrinomonadaceae bacterium]